MYTRALTTLGLGSRKRENLCSKETSTSIVTWSETNLCEPLKFFIDKFSNVALYYLAKIQYFKINCPQWSSVRLVDYKVHSGKNYQVRENTALWLLLNCGMCLQFWLIFCGGLHKLYFSNLMEENAFCQSQITQVIKENAKTYLESQIPGTLYFFVRVWHASFHTFFRAFF